MNRKLSTTLVLIGLMVIIAGCTAPSKMSRNELLARSTQNLCNLYRLDPGANIMRVLEERDQFTDREISLIRKRDVGTGMSEEALRCSWGSPRTINRSAGSWGSQDQYVYRGCDTCKTYYIYVERGEVTAFQSL